MNRILLTACALLFAVPALIAQGASDEHRLKAAFVFRFPQFIGWPPAVMTGRDGFNICVDGSAATEAALHEITAGESLRGLRLVVRGTPSLRELSSCHLLVMTGAQPDRELMNLAAGLPILTVGDSESFLEAGGIIQLKIVDRRVRFDVNLPAASRARLTLSSQLLRLAATVRGER